jgi:hypothetical protein
MLFSCTVSNRALRLEESDHYHWNSEECYLEHELSLGRC